MPDEAAPVSKNNGRVQASAATVQTGTPTPDPNSDAHDIGSTPNDAPPTPSLGEPGFDAAVAEQVKSLEAAIDEEKSSRLLDTLRAELQDMLRGDVLDVDTLLQISKFASAAVDLVNVQQPLSNLKKRTRRSYSRGFREGADVELSDNVNLGVTGDRILWSSGPGGALSPSSSSETFGAQVVRQGIAALTHLTDALQGTADRAVTGSQRPRADELVRAITAAQDAGDVELVVELKAALRREIGPATPQEEEEATEESLDQAHHAPTSAT